MEPFVSDATRRNWEKLGESGEGKLMRRANKTRSARLLWPAEYLTHAENRPLLTAVAAEIAEGISAGRYDIATALFSLAVGQMRHTGVLTGAMPQTRAAADFMQTYAALQQIPELCERVLPADEFDALGLLYQALLTEGARNRQGVYYTPAAIAAELTADLDFSAGQRYLDPCCGSGSFLLTIDTDKANPAQLLGMDSDPVAVLLARANLLLAYRDKTDVPQIMHGDFTAEQALPPAQVFDAIIGNPPWGASGTGEPFAVFLRRALAILKPGGTVRYLLPEAFLHAGVYGALRRTILQSTAITEIRRYPRLFSGVTTPFIALSLCREAPRAEIPVREGEKNYRVATDGFTRLRHTLFSLMPQTDRAIVDVLYHRGRHDLSASTWALGIVTGNNAQKLSTAPIPGGEPIYTGREIAPYQLLPPRRYVVYNRADWQQSAPEAVYRAPEKLVYRFIAARPIVACDSSGSLCLNSANILIPAVPGMGIKTVMLLLNSDLFGFAYHRLFSTVKVLKGHLAQLPLPPLTAREDLLLTALAEDILAGHTAAIAQAQEFLYDYYGITQTQRAQIQAALPPSNKKVK